MLYNNYNAESFVSLGELNRICIHVICKFTTTCTLCVEMYHVSVKYELGC